MRSALGWLALLLVATVIVTSTGCAIPDHERAWAFDWDGRTSNILGSEQPRELDAPDGLSSPEVEAWDTGRGSTAVAVRMNASGATTLLEFHHGQSSAVMEGARLAGATADGSLHATLLRRYDSSASETFAFARSVVDGITSPPAAAAIPLEGTATLEFRGHRVRLIHVELASREAVPLYRAWFEHVEASDRAAFGAAPDWYAKRSREPDRLRAELHGTLRGWWLPGLSAS